MCLINDIGCSDFRKRNQSYILTRLSIADLSVRGRRNFNPKTMQINTGTHTLRLYTPPVPDPGQVPLEEIQGNHDWRRYGKATLRIHIFQGNPRPGSLTPSDMSEDGEDVLPEYSWLPFERSKPCRDPFLSGDGFDVYVDGCRYLPDSVTFSKVSGVVPFLWLVSLLRIKLLESNLTIALTIKSNLWYTFMNFYWITFDTISEVTWMKTWL